jgi:Subtilase family
VPLRSPRPFTALIAAGIAASLVALSAMPAMADQVRNKEWWLSSLGITGAWAASQGAGVTVAVLSDGVDASQADLTGAVTTAPAPAGAPVATGQYFGEQGTAIASLIAGRGHGLTGGAGIIGVAPRARILSVPVTLPDDDPLLSQPAVAAAIPAAIAAGIRYAVGHGATVIDLPIDPGQPGSTGTGGAAAAAGGSAAEQSAVSYALDHDVVLVAPAGDDGTASDAPNYPAAYHGVIAVGAFNSAFIKAAWSSHQGYVTLTAAGAGVIAAANDGGYQTINSTSAASAVVSGVAALIRSQYPNLTAAEVRQALITSTVYRPANGLADGSGYGTVNASKALAAAAVLATPPSDLAGARAQPLVPPAAIPAVSSTQGIESSLLRAGELSAGLLLVLLLLIAGYAATGRRGSRRPSPVTAEWIPRQGQSRYPHASGPDADRMLEFFTAPVAEPRGAASQPDLRPATANHSNQGLFAPAASGPQAAGNAADRRPLAAGLGSPAETGRLLPDGPASRAVSRRPAVSGAPPWEPAPAPDGELPWTAVPGRHALGGRPVVSAAPASQQAWQASAGQNSPFRPARQREDAGSADQPGWAAEQTDWTAGPADREAGPPGWDAAGTGQPDWNGGTSGQPVWNGWPAEAAGPAALDGTDSDPQAPTPPAPPTQPLTAGSELPVRPVRQPTPAPLSPSGSLWEPIDAESGGDVNEGLEGGSRPIYVWNPSAQQRPETYPTRPAELRRALAEWRMRD